VPVAEGPHRPDAFERVDHPATMVVRVLQADHARRREMDVVVVVHEPFHGLRVECPVGRVEAAQLKLTEDRCATLLVEQDVRLRVQEDLVTALRQGMEGDLVAHRPRRAVERRFLVQQTRDLFLQAVDGGVVLEHIVADLGLGHGPAHLRPRLRHRIAAHVDHARAAVMAARHHRSPFPLFGRGVPRHRLGLTAFGVALSDAGRPRSRGDAVARAGLGRGPQGLAPGLEASTRLHE